MKNTFHFMPFVILLLFTQLNVNAQKLTITDGTTTYDDHEHPCISVQIEPKTKTVKGELKDWMKDNHDFKLRGFGFLVNKDVLKAEEVSIPVVSENEMDFYAEIIEENGITQMNVFASFGYDIHLSKEKFPKEYRALKSLTLDFLSEFLPNYYQDKIDDTKDLLSDIEANRKDLQEEIEDNTEEIVELKKENIDLSNEVNEKDSEIKSASKKLEKQKVKLKTINQKLQNSEEKSKGN